MHTKTIAFGRLANQIIRNLCVSIIAEKFNLYVEYSEYSKILSLGINLFVGSKIFDNTIVLNDYNFFDILNQPVLSANLDGNNSFFQTKEITNFLYDYLNTYKIKCNIINKNPFKERINNNNDCFVHIRLTDASEWSPKLDYFLNSINNITYDNLYIASDDINHEMVKAIKNEKNCVILQLDDVRTIQFGSTCKTIILSQGTYSAMIGYLGFDSTIIYYRNNVWHGNIYEINRSKWIKNDEYK